ncbi:hypothetical protein J6590_067961 [Homalodisca vitripennis]|nr:hypothetical protein J6590_067961 [Homalodisca vitripennis]
MQVSGEKEELEGRPVVLVERANRAFDKCITGEHGNLPHRRCNLHYFKLWRFVSSNKEDQLCVEEVKERGENKKETEIRSEATRICTECKVGSTPTVARETEEDLELTNDFQH